MACVLDLLERGVDKGRIQLWHQHVDGGDDHGGLMDWPVTSAYCRAVAAALGIRILFQWREGGFEREMNRENARTAPVRFERQDGTWAVAGGVRGKESTRLQFPQVSADLSVRWCSPYVKIDVAAIAINNDPDLVGKKILYVSGERREESPARSRYAEKEQHRCHSSKRRVDHWRNVIDWNESRVWDIIRRWSVNPHPAYRLGWGRVSCALCIFGRPDQWASARKILPDRFGKVAAYERQYGKTIHRTKTVTEQADQGNAYANTDDPYLVALATGTEFTEPVLVNSWEAPAGAFAECGGPI